MFENIQQKDIVQFLIINVSIDMSWNSSIFLEGGDTSFNFIMSG